MSFLQIYSNTNTFKYRLGYFIYYQLYILSLGITQLVELLIKSWMLSERL